MRKIILGCCSGLLLSSLMGCDAFKGLSESEQIERTIRQEIQRNEQGLTALIAIANNTDFDGFAWRRGEPLQVRKRTAEGLALLTDVTVPEIITSAVANNVPSFSLVRYQQGWLVVFRNYLSPHCQAVYAYAYQGVLTDTPQCDEQLFAAQANGQCQAPINAQWVIFKEWFFAETLADEGNPVCQQKAAAGWEAKGS
ncbi:hypothetical protein [Alishewanella tabrizica]|nr:hypothetical protein [Alishewanella tabrizica]